MTRLFSTGAEAGSLGVLSAVSSGVSISSAQKRTGAYSFYVSRIDYSGLGQVIFPTSPTILYFRVGLYLVQPGGGVSLMQLLDSAGNPQCSLKILVADNTLHVMQGWGRTGTDLGGSAHAVPLNQWCCIEWYILIGDGAAGASTVKIDGTTELTLAGVDTQETGVAGAKSVYYGADYQDDRHGSIKGYYDDLAINDNAGAVNNSWIGRGGIYGIVPDGVGNYTDLIASAGNAWDCIEEVPPSDADYVYESTVNKKSTYALGALTPTTGTIDCINVIMRAKLDAAGTGNIARLIRSNGTDSQGADVGLDVSAKTIQDIIETDPSGGAAFTVARVNALEAGAVVR